MTWRVARPLRKSMHEIAQVLVGRKGRSGGSSASRLPFRSRCHGADGTAPPKEPAPDERLPIAIHKTGLVTSVGLTAPASCAAFRAKLTNPTETRFIDSGGEWIMAHQVALEQPWRGLTKLARMAAMAIDEASKAFRAERVVGDCRCCCAWPRRNGRAASRA